MTTAWGGWSVSMYSWLDARTRRVYRLSEAAVQRGIRTATTPAEAAAGMLQLDRLRIIAYPFAIIEKITERSER